jgi:hypothetical protein
MNFGVFDPLWYHVTFPMSGLGLQVTSKQIFSTYISVIQG